MDTWLVVGLGNPGAAYAANRHNVGAMVVDELASRHDLGSLVVDRVAFRRGTSKAGGTAGFKTHKARARVAEVRLRVPGPKLILAVPLTYMNVSGGPVAALMKYYDIPVDRLIVVHDELDIEAGLVRLKRGGGEGGHNGLRSISQSIGTKDYLRVRVGIGRPPGRQDPAEYVLKDFSRNERSELPLLLDEAADAVEALVDVGLVDAQQRFHAPR
ncbi:aminoacyl-tRNA hydrolase [Intrasporangium sp.]|uniref:aminoacyl-tRNA hydrolase n=1 Tax=Intrasporangium sp. TaxID=1925024 RepID=UPI00293A856D|nr:aminoacyl-tRNA hydrolase [Intrasporangium sp.]MDV3222368.1 aminoacyl-tRNA hydrolase [Intrasporangium sp.]